MIRYAAYFSSSGNIEVLKLPISSAYIAYYHDTVLNHGRRFMRQGKWYIHEGHDVVLASPVKHDEVKIKKIFQATLNHLNENLAASLSRPYKIVSASSPSIFNDTSSSALLLTVFPNGLHADDGPFHRSATANSAMFAYGLDRCETFGRSAAECERTDDIASLALVIEYEKKYLYFSIIHGGDNEPVFPIVQTSVATDLGEESEARQKMSAAYFQEQVSRRINELVASVVGDDRGYVKDDIRAVVLIGEASSEAMCDIGNITVEVLSSFDVKFFDSINPAVAAAHGQAHFARDVMRNPRVYGGVHYKGPQFPEDEKHDEL